MFLLEGTEYFKGVEFESKTCRALYFSASKSIKINWFVQPYAALFTPALFSGIKIYQNGNRKRDGIILREAFSLAKTFHTA
jgi:hypothetical protein